jgi:aryl-alcohol dehydrogenase-like predicted oxidoreductase
MGAAFSGGITTFDVARSYGYGDAERILGRFARGRRSRIQIVTKAGIRPGRTSPVLRAAKSAARAVFSLVPGAKNLARPALARQRSSGHFAPAELEASLTASLRALETDYVDAFLLHACDEQVVDQAAVLEAMNGFVVRGMARRVGVASGAAEAVRWLQRGGEPTIEVGVHELGELQGDPSSVELLLANQPLGGGELLRAVDKRCRSHGLDQSAALELLLHRPLQMGATGVVMSMLSVQHVERALTAHGKPQFSSAQRHELTLKLLAGT